MDLCFELATQIMSRLRGAVATADEVQGFSYFDDRDLIGFVDGTENRRGTRELGTPPIIGEEDAKFAGGSYVIVQKYLHDLDGWNTLPDRGAGKDHRQEKSCPISSWTDAVKPTSAHNALTNHRGGWKAAGRSCGTTCPSAMRERASSAPYFIGYARSPHRIEQMLVNMFVGQAARQL